MQLSPHLVGPTMMVVCAAMVLAAAAIYWSTALGSAWTVPRAAVRAVLQLVAVAAILATALSNLRTSLVVLGIMFVAATVTAARRSRCNRSWLLAVALASGMISVVHCCFQPGWCPSPVSPSCLLPASCWEAP